MGASSQSSGSAAKNGQNNLSPEQINLVDELNKLQIDQLHKATLNFSNNSLEAKKLCVAVESAVLTLVAGIYKDSPIKEWLPLISIFGGLVPFLFYIVDAVLWFYQDRLRERMISEENQIRSRHGVSPRKSNSKTTLKRVLRSLFNGSQSMYFGLMLLALFVYYIYTKI